MAKLSQKQLEEMARKRQHLAQEESPEMLRENLSEKQKSIPQSKMISDIMGDESTQLYKYSLPETAIKNRGENSIPMVDPDEYPILNIKGQMSRKRQARGYNLFVSKEINHIISKNMQGNNMNATLNFLLWVGLQTLKGINQPIDIRVHDDTYPDGLPISDYIKIEE